MIKLLLSLSVLVLAGCAAPTLKILTYNIHHGRGLDGEVDLDRIAAVIEASEADMVALQEVDVGVARSGRLDLPAELARRTGMTAVFGKNLDYQGGDYGNALLTRVPLLRHDNHHYRMLRAGEQRGLLLAVVDWHGTELGVLVTHLDYRPDGTERLAHADEIAARATELAPRPVVLCGDLNEQPGDGLLAKLEPQFRDAWPPDRGPGLTYPSNEPRKRIDYVLLHGNIQSTGGRVLTSAASDHCPLLVTVSRAR